MILDLPWDGKGRLALALERLERPRLEDLAPSVPVPEWPRLVRAIYTPLSRLHPPHRLGSCRPVPEEPPGRVGCR